MRLLAETTLPLHSATGLVLSRPVAAVDAVPPFANSGVDGYAVRSADVVAAPVELPVTGDLPAGSAPATSLQPGTAIRIMTGAPLPVGADAVVMVEDTTRRGDRVRIGRPASAGAHVRPAGGDVAAGQVVLAAGERLGPAALGVLAAVGAAEVPVRRRPVVAVLSTGDELRPVEAAGLPPGAIRDANRPLLLALLHELGADVRDLGIVPDDARLLRSVLEEAAEGADAVVSSGGVSMGAHDLVKTVLSDLGRVGFWQVAMQPAKPFAFGFLGDTPFFGLPGNPVSVMVAFEQFVRPGLLAAMGARRLFRPRIRAVLGAPLVTASDKVVFARVRFTAPGVVEPSGAQASNVLSALAAADAFAVVPVGVAAVAAGAEVTLELFRAAEIRTLEDADDD